MAFIKIAIFAVVKGLFTQHIVMLSNLLVNIIYCCVSSPQSQNARGCALRASARDRERAREQRPSERSEDGKKTPVINLIYSLTAKVLYMHPIGWSVHAPMHNILKPYVY